VTVPGRHAVEPEARATAGRGTAVQAIGWWPFALALILLLAAILRLHDLPARGTWDADQGHDMLVMTDFVQHGTPPLLGPPTSIGDFHHGALYYYVLAPAALIGGGDPTIVIGEIALLGVAAVGLVAALARSAAGPVAGLASGLLMAVSSTAVDESTFLWNPNIVAFGSALAVAAAWRAWTSRNPRWWVVAAIGQAITQQGHILGWALLPALAVWLIADARRRQRRERARVLAAGLGALVLIAASYVPLLASELQTGFHETRAAVAFLSGGGQASSADPIVRLVFVTLRILSWPLTSLLTGALAPGVAAGVGVAALLVWRARRADEPERSLTRWILATVLWSCVVLGVGVSSLASVTPLPVDHYHAFLDPLIDLALGLGAAGLWRAAPAVSAATANRLGRLTPGRIAAVAIVAALIAWNLANQPPGVAHDGGYPAAEAAAGRVGTVLAGRAALIVSLPEFKTAEAYLYPARRLGLGVGSAVADPMGLDRLVVLCDDLFVQQCGGAAEDAAARAYATTAWGPGEAGIAVLDRFRPAPGRTISIYRLGPG
jgi:4-amino-4-deoxy-L-arabinose transferase-like glycosyltransferase